MIAEVEVEVGYDGCDWRATVEVDRTRSDCEAEPVGALERMNENAEWVVVSWESAPGGLLDLIEERAMEMTA